MHPRHLIAVLALSHALAAVALAQSAGPSVAAPSEFGRVSGGEISAITKHSSSLSGSLGISASRSQLPFATDAKGFDATLGGTLVQDRVWFFATAERNDSLFSSRRALPATATAGGTVDSHLAANFGDQQTLAASFATARHLSATPGTTAAIPSSFLNLRYTGIVSGNMFFTATVSQSKSVQPQISWAVAGPSQ